MCRRCVIKERDVAKSVELVVDAELLKRVMATKDCIAIIEIDGMRMAVVNMGNMGNMQAAKVKEGKYPEVSIGYALHGRQMAAAIHQRVKSNTDPKNRPPLSSLNDEVRLGPCGKNSPNSCTCGEDDGGEPTLPHKTWCPKA